MIYGHPLVLGGSSGVAPKLFGDGSDGVAIISADTTWDAPVQDTSFIEKNFESLTIPEGVTVSAGNRNAGMIIRVKGDCTIAGTIANRLSCKTLRDSDGVDFSVYPPSMLTTVAGAGGAGGAVKASGSNSIHWTLTLGRGMPGRFYGGGWSGGGSGGSTSFSSTSSTSYGWGASGGPADGITTDIPDSEIFKGGTSGTSLNAVNPNVGYHGGGGAGGRNGGTGGNGGTGPGGDGVSASTATAGGGGGAGNIGGGVVILMVGGNLTVTSTGCIDCSGGNGGRNSGNMAANRGSSKYTPTGGGGGGGGRIYVVHKGDIQNDGTCNVNGGLGGETSTGSSYIQPESGELGTVDIKTYDQYMTEEVS